jgi:hypothetical protein
MRVKAMVYMACIFSVIGFAAIGRTQNAGQENVEFEELEKKMLELEREMDKMKREYESEINELTKEVERLSKSTSPTEQAGLEGEAAKLRQLAESLAGEKKQEQIPEKTVFKFSGMSLQQLNPEISVSGDFVASYRNQTGNRRRTDATLRGLELNFQSYLDPFSRLKATTHIHSDGEVHLEEAYFTRFSVLNNANVDVGKFRQQFGVVNRWHLDAFDQVEYPLALRMIFGEEGLSQTGASLEWTLPECYGACQVLTAQVTIGENECLFAGNTLGNPSLLLHYKNYRDLSRDTYLEFGLTSLLGWNDEWNVQQGDDIGASTDALATYVFGADLSFLWEPADRALYRNVEWRTEFYLLNRRILAPDNSGVDSLKTWGAYSYLQARVARNLEVGVRCDYYKPDSKSYADIEGASLVPLAYATQNPYRWQICPYITWWQSEWVKFRGEYDYGWGKGMENSEHVFWLQAIFAAGPHKHERY